jgi:hypothetical protein
MHGMHERVKYELFSSPSSVSRSGCTYDPGNRDSRLQGTLMKWDFAKMQMTKMAFEIAVWLDEDPLTCVACRKSRTLWLQIPVAKTASLCDAVDSNRSA